MDSCLTQWLPHVAKLGSRRGQAQQQGLLVDVFVETRQVNSRTQQGLPMLLMAMVTATIIRREAKADAQDNALTT